MDLLINNLNVSAALEVATLSQELANEWVPVLWQCVNDVALSYQILKESR